MDNPLVLAALFVGSIILAGFGGWAVVNYVLKPPVPDVSQGEVQPLPLPEDIEQPPEQTDIQEPQLPEPVEDRPTDYTTALGLAVGDQKTVEGGINRGETVNYQIEGKAGQTLRANLEGDGVVLSVLNADNRELRGGRQVLDWEGDLPEDGLYTVQIETTRGTEQGTYELGLTLAGADATEPLTGTEPSDEGNGADEDTGEPPSSENGEEDDLAKLQDEISTQRVQFPEGQSGALLANSVGPGRVQRYVVNAQQGQIITVKITQANGPVTFDVSFPGGEPIADAEEVLYWNSYLPLGGDYAVDVRSSSEAEFTLDVQIVGQGTSLPQL